MFNHHPIKRALAGGLMIGALIKPRFDTGDREVSGLGVRRFTPMSEAASPI